MTHTVFPASLNEGSALYLPLSLFLSISLSHILSLSPQKEKIELLRGGFGTKVCLCYY